MLFHLGHITSRPAKRGWVEQILHIALPGLGEFFKVARFQAKKYQSKGKRNGDETISFRVDGKQLDILRDRADLCYYVVCDRYIENQFCANPLVAGITTLFSTSDDKIDETKDGKLSGLCASNDYIDLAFFLTFDLADRASAAGYLARDEQDARNALLWGTSNKDGQQIDRVLVVTLGSPPRPIDWDHVFHPNDH